MSLRFAFLVLKEHPYGREMLRILLERGFCPDLIASRGPRRSCWRRPPGAADNHRSHDQSAYTVQRSEQPQRLHL